jgi:hypothetical protein
MRAKEIFFSAFFFVTLLSAAPHAVAHCDLAYSAGPKVSYKVTASAIVRSRTSVLEAESVVARGNASGRKSYSAMTASEVRAAMPPDSISPRNNDLGTRQKSLTYWLLYTRKLYEEDQFGMVANTIGALRARGLLRDSDALGGYDDGDVERGAYFSVPNLTRIFRAYEEPAKLALLSAAGFNTNYRAALQATIETQANTFNFDDSNLPLMMGVRTDFLPTVSQVALRPAADFARSQALEKRWDLISKLEEYNEVLGISNDIKGRVEMYVNTGTVVASLAVNEQTGRSSLFSGLSCQNDFEQTLGLIAESLPQDKGVALGALVKAADRYVLTVDRRGHVYVTESEMNQLMTGKTVAGLDQDERVGGFDKVVRELIETDTSLVLYSHPMMQKNGPARQATMRFAHAIARAYPALNVVIDEPNPRVPSLAQAIASLSISPQDVYVVIDAQYSVKFQGELADDADEVRKLIGNDNVVFFDGTEPNLPPSPHERAVIVITGHADVALENFIDHLADKGYLRNNLVVLQSCGDTPLSSRLVSKINNKYEAAGTFHYPEKILERDALIHTKELLKSTVDAVGVSFGRLVRDRAGNPSKPWGRAMNGVWTICWFLRPTLVGNG